MVRARMVHARVGPGHRLRSRLGRAWDGVAAGAPAAGPGGGRAAARRRAGRHGRLAEAAAIWDEVARDTPDDVWLYNNAGLEYGAIGEHQIALAWLTKGVELAVRTGDRERLVGQLRGLRADSLAALGREPDRLRTAEPRPVARPPSHRPPPTPSPAPIASGHARHVPAARAWLPADEYPHLEERWPDIADGPATQADGDGLVDHATYCRRMERRLREASDVGMTAIRIAPVRWTEFTSWREENREEGDPADLRARYAADLLPTRRE